MTNTFANTYIDSFSRLFQNLIMSVSYFFGHIFPIYIFVRDGTILLYVVIKKFALVMRHCCDVTLVRVYELPFLSAGSVVVFFRFIYKFVEIGMYFFFISRSLLLLFEYFWCFWNICRNDSTANATTGFVFS